MEGSRPDDPRSAGESRPQVPPAPGAPGPGGVPSARSQQLLTLRRGGGNGAMAEAPRDPAAASPGQGKQGNMVMVWPQLVRWTIRLVTHRHITAADVETAAEVIREVAAGAPAAVA